MEPVIRHHQTYEPYSDKRGLNPFPNDKFFGDSAYKLKEFADDDFKFDENGRKFFKWVGEKKKKKTVGKEKLLVTSNISFSQGVSKRLVLQTRKNHGLFGKGLIHVSDP